MATWEEKFERREQIKERVWYWTKEEPKTMSEICQQFKFGKTSSRSIIDKMVREGYLTIKQGAGSRAVNLYKAVADKPYKAKQEFVCEFADKHKNPLKSYSEFGGVILTDRDNPNLRTYLNLESRKTAHAPRPKRKVNVWIGTSMGALGEASDY